MTEMQFKNIQYVMLGIGAIARMLNRRANWLYKREWENIVEQLNNELQALMAVSEALVKIRLLSRNPMTAKNQRAIFEIADAFHNIPEKLAGTSDQRKANLFLVEAGIIQAREAYARHGIHSQVLPPLVTDPLPESPVGNENDPASIFKAKYGHLPSRFIPYFFKKKQ